MAKTMKQTKTGTGLRLDATTVDKMGRDVAEVGMGVIMVLAALIGIWGIACLMGGLAQTGIGEMISGERTAGTGREQGGK